MPFLDEATVERVREAERKWMHDAFYKGCPNCGQRLCELPTEANIFPHMNGACKDQK